MLILVTSICENASFLATVLFLKKIVRILSIIVPIILVLLVSVDIAKAVMANDDNQMKTAQKLAIKRIIWGVVIFFVPIAVNAVFSLFDGKEVAGIACYNNATDEVVKALQQASDEKLLAYEEDIQKLIEAAQKGKTAKDKELARIREKAEKARNKESNDSGDASLQPWFEALEAQYRWAKDSKYGYVKHPSVANSKNKGSCVTYVVVSMQRAKLLPKGKNIIYEEGGNFKLNSYGKKHIKKHSDKLSYSYVDSSPKTLYKYGKIKAGDILTFDFAPSGHTMVFMGTNKKGKLIWATGGSTKCYKCEMPDYVNKKASIVIKVKKV